MTSRPLPVLLDLIDAKPTDPFIMDRAVEAHQAGLISNAEVRHLQAFERRPVKSRKRALADTVDVSDKAINEMKAKLAAASEALRVQQERPGAVGQAL